MNFYAKQETERKLRQWPYLAYSSGKSTCIQESARLMGQNLVFRTITYLTDFHILELVSDQRQLNTILMSRAVKMFL